MSTPLCRIVLAPAYGNVRSEAPIVINAALIGVCLHPDFHSDTLEM